MSADELNAALAHPADADASRRAHQVAAQRAAALCTRYGMPAVREFLRNGVPANLLKGMPGQASSPD